MDDQLENRYKEALEYFEVFEERLARLSPDPNNIEMQSEIGELWILAKINCDITSHPDIASYSYQIQASLDDLREGSPGTQQV